MWRKVPHVQMKGSDEAFITKLALVLGQCPVPYCPENGGNHRTLPTACLDWLREEGSKMLGWKGVDGTTTEKAMKEKISNLKKKQRFRNRDESQTLRQKHHSKRARAVEGDQREDENHWSRPCEWTLCFQT